MNPKIWKTTTHGTDIFQYVSLTNETIEGALNVTRNSFYLYESGCTALGLQQEGPEAVKELEELTLRAAKDGVSIVAIEKSTGKVVGVAFNKIQVKSKPGKGTFFENFAKECKYSASRGFVQFMADVDAACDIFELCKIDCLLELMFLSVLPEYGSRTIGENLSRLTVELAKKLSKGENVKQSLEIGKKISLEPIPQAVAVMFTSDISQKIGRKLKLNIAATLPYDNFFIQNGKPFSSVIGPRQKACSLEYTKL